ncbi:hypothetical protein Tco_0319105 [Tanacetum coccineum]
MIRATQPAIIQSAILKNRALTDEAVRCGTLSSKKRKEVVESCKQGGSWTDNKRAKLGKGCMAAVPTRNKYAGSHPRDSRSPVKQVVPVNAVRMRKLEGAHFSFIYIDIVPLLNVKPGILRSSYVIEIVQGIENKAITVTFGQDSMTFARFLRSRRSR